MHDLQDLWQEQWFFKHVNHLQVGFVARSLTCQSEIIFISSIVYQTFEFVFFIIYVIKKSGIMSYFKNVVVTYTRSFNQLRMRPNYSLHVHGTYRSRWAIAHVHVTHLYRMTIYKLMARLVLVDHKIWIRGYAIRNTHILCGPFIRDMGP